MTDWVSISQQNQGIKPGGGQASGGKSFTQGASDVLRSIGLGAIPTIGAGVYESGRAIDSALGDKNAYVNQQTGQANQDPFATQRELGQYSTPMGGAIQAGKDVAGLASYGVPETKILPGGGGLLSKLVAGIVNRGAQGAVMGGLQSVSQGQNPVQGAATGAVVNPVLTGAGNVLTDLLPRYIGFRNYGGAGLKLPEVVKGENDAANAGLDTLEAARNDVVKNLPNFEMNPTGPATDRFALMNKIDDLAQKPQWIGTPGISDLKKTSTKAFPQYYGVLRDVNNAVQNSDNAFDAYNRIKNMAYAKGNTETDFKVSNFLKSAAATARQHLIDVSPDSAATQKAMDLYAASTAIGKGKGVTAKNAVSALGQYVRGGVGEGGLAGLAALLPMVQPAAIPLGIDTALTNSITGPATARGLINTGQAIGNSGASNLLRVLGIAGANNAVNLGNGR